MGESEGGIVPPPCPPPKGETLGCQLNPVKKLKFVSGFQASPFGPRKYSGDTGGGLIINYISAVGPYNPGNFTSSKRK
jgi:hypothetical protein